MKKRQNNKNIKPIEENPLPEQKFKTFDINVETNVFTFLSAAIIVVLIFLMYSNIYKNTFQFDDILWLENPAVVNFTNIWDFQLSRIVPFYTFAINYQWFQNETWGYSLFNVLVHVFNSLLVWKLIRLTLNSPSMKETEIAKHVNLISLFGALIFALHPLQTQAVTYIYQRLASMAAFFYLLAIASYVWARMLTRWKLLRIPLYMMFLLSFFLGAFTKENTFTLPIVLILYELFFLRKKFRFKWTHLLTLILFIGALFAFAYIFDAPKRIRLETEYYTGEKLTNENYLFTQFRVLIFYLKLFILPVGQNVDHEFRLSLNFWDWDVILSVVFHLLLISASFFMYKRNRMITFGILWFYITIAIESSIIPISDVVMEHRVYLPMFGLAIAFLALLYEIGWRKYSNVYLLAISVLIVILGMSTFIRNMVWENDLTLWSDVISKSPNKARGYNNRGLYYLQAGAGKNAIEDFTASINLNQKWRYNFILPYKNRGLAYFLTRRFPEAIEDFNKYIDSNKWDVEIYNNRANCYMELKEYSNAITDYKKYLATFPSAYIIQNNVGLAYFYISDYQNAIESFTKAIEINPNDFDAHANRADAYFNLEDYKSALTDYRIALIIEPNNAIIKKKIDDTEKMIKNNTE